MKKKILVVDDEEVNRSLVAAFLQYQFPDAEILQAQNGLEAKTKLEECPVGALPNALFTDFEMPGMNGLELIRFIRNSDNPALSDLPIVMVSGLAGERAVTLMVNVKTLNCFFLAKPFKSEEFFQILSEVWQV